MQNQAGSIYGLIPTDKNHLIETKEYINCDLSSHSFCNSYNEDYSHSNIINSDLHKDNFYACNFFNSSIVNSFVYSATIKFSNFSEVNFEGSKLDFADVRNSYFSGSSFNGAGLKKAEFTHSNLSSTDFTNANTVSVIFYRTILIGSNISQKQLNAAKDLSYSVLPNGIVVPPVDEYENCR